jgi:hypothetical protein
MGVEATAIAADGRSEHAPKISNHLDGHSSHDGGAVNAACTVLSHQGGRTNRPTVSIVPTLFLLHVVCKNVKAVCSAAEESPHSLTRAQMR